jgi:hypothetical protein
MIQVGRRTIREERFQININQQGEYFTEFERETRAWPKRKKWR